MPLWLLLDKQSKYDDGTVFMLDCDMCESWFGFCDCDVTSNAPISDLWKEVDSTDWLVLRSDRPGVTVKFICPGCQASPGESGFSQLPDITPERPSPIDRMRAAGDTLEVGRFQKWDESSPQTKES